MKKKGMYFTLMTIAFLFVFLFVFMMPSYKRINERMSVIEMRVDSMNDFVKDLERDVERGIYISSYRALMALEEYIIREGKFLNNTEEMFMEALLYGTVNSTNSTLMIGSTLPQWLENIRLESNKLKINVSMVLHETDIFQTDPWHVVVWTNISFYIDDTAGIASWRREQQIESQIKINSFEDPLYIVYSLGRITNVINATPYQGNYTFKKVKWNVSNLMEHIENSYYVDSGDAPSFLMRFENNLTSSGCCGIESMVNLIKVSEQGLSVHGDSSIIDYHYWTDSGDGDYRINFTPDWVKLDSGHLERYNLTLLNWEI